MKLGVHIGYWGLGLTREDQKEIALEAERLEPGQRVLCLGVGSGLNTTLMEIAW